MKKNFAYSAILMTLISGQAAFADGQNNSPVEDICQEILTSSSYQGDERLGNTPYPIDIASCYYHSMQPIVDELDGAIAPTDSINQFSVPPIDPADVNNLTNSLRQNQNAILANSNEPELNPTPTPTPTPEPDLAPTPEPTPTPEPDPAPVPEPTPIAEPEPTLFKGYFSAYGNPDDHDTITQTADVPFTHAEGEQDVSFDHDSSERTFLTGKKDHFGEYDYTAIVEGYISGDEFNDNVIFATKQDTNLMTLENDDTDDMLDYWVVGLPTEELPQQGHAYYEGEVLGNSFVETKQHTDYDMYDGIKGMKMFEYIDVTPNVLSGEDSEIGFVNAEFAPIAVDNIQSYRKDIVDADSEVSGIIQIYADFNTQQLGGHFSVHSNDRYYERNGFYSEAKFSKLDIDIETKSFEGDLEIVAHGQDQKLIGLNLGRRLRGDGGFIRGRFFGPSAQEIGGQWLINEENSETAAWGVFRAQDAWNGSTFSTLNDGVSFMRGSAIYIGSHTGTYYADTFREGLLDHDPVQLSFANYVNVPIEDKDYFGEYAYTAMGRWASDDYNLFRNDYYNDAVGGYWVVGEHATEIPTQGSADYAGDLKGDFLSADGTITRDAMGGTINLTVDFGTKLVDGDLSITKNGAAYADADFDNASLYGDSFYDSLNINNDTTKSGSIDGRLYGKGAAEAGGTWRIDGSPIDPTDYNSRDQAIGIFRAKQIK